MFTNNDGHINFTTLNYTTHVYREAFVSPFNVTFIIGVQQVIFHSIYSLLPFDFWDSSGVGYSSRGQ